MLDKARVMASNLLSFVLILQKAMWLFEGSNADRLWGQVEQKDMQLQLQLSMIQQKDALLQEARMELTSALKENAALRENMAHTQNALKQANHEVLGLLAKRNIRGALEHIASRLGQNMKDGKGGVQNKLDRLAYDKSFTDLVHQIADQHNLVEKDMMTCLRNMYHSFSKDMHGSESHVYIRVRDISSPAERAVLAAIFEHQIMPYVVVDAEGSELNPSPYNPRL
jgi:hypothetical protein